jgi:hypothetical protein
MQQFLRLASGFSSPVILIIAIWCSVLVAVAIGPIDYPGQPSSTVLVIVAAGVSLFILGYGAGSWCFGSWFERQSRVPAPSIRRLNNVVIATSLSGIGGIGLIAFDRVVLSGVSNSGYAELLRCAPSLVDFIQIQRTPLLYVGYLTFSFGFASLALFLLKGEEIRGWAAIAAQLSIVCPIGYALLYSGRMPILFTLVLIVSVMLVRISQGRPLLPRGHYLLLKTGVLVLLFAIYSSAIWSRRSNFCAQMSGVIQELEQKKTERDVEQAEVRQEPEPKAQDPVVERASRPPPPPSSIRATDVSKMVTDATKVASETTSPPAAAPAPTAVIAPAVISTEALLGMMREAWNVKPRGYVLSAIDSGKLSTGGAITFLSTYFYLTHGVRAADITWQAREKLSPQWGVYEVGILSPILRVIRPDNQRLADMETQLRDAGIYGFFPTVWAAAYIDFGIVGGVLYILIWGFAGGWSAAGTRRSALATPSLLLVFILASIFLSPVQAPLGVANSALVLFSVLVTGAAIDLMGMRDKSRHASRELRLGRSVG